MSNSIQPKQFAAPHAAEMAADLVPDDGSEKAKALNAYYHKIVEGMQFLFNSTGPKLAAVHKVEAREARGIFISAHQQMLCAIVAMQFGLRKDQQLWLADRILAAIKGTVTCSPLELPPAVEQTLADDAARDLDAHPVLLRAEGEPGNLSCPLQSESQL